MAETLIVMDQAKSRMCAVKAAMVARPGVEVYIVSGYATKKRWWKDDLGLRPTLRPRPSPPERHTIAIRVSPDGKAVEVVDRIVEKPADGPLDAAIARAKARGAAKVTEILRQADMVTAREFGPLIGASHETVNIKRKRHEILGLEGATRGIKYPRWQITEAGMPLPGLARLFRALG